MARDKGEGGMATLTGVFQLDLMSVLGWLVTRLSGVRLCSPCCSGHDLEIPEGWVLKYDDSAGANYFYNIVTGESSWTLPH